MWALYPGGGLFNYDYILLYPLKTSNQDLSNKDSKIVLNLLEVGFLIAQTQAIFDQSFENSRYTHNRA